MFTKDVAVILGVTFPVIEKFHCMTKKTNNSKKRKICLEALLRQSTTYETTSKRCNRVYKRKCFRQRT